MSYLSTGVDVLVFTMMLVALTVALPLQFAHGPAPALYFLVIGLAAMRRSRRLVLLSGIVSSVALLAVSLTATFWNLGSMQLVADVGGYPMDFNILDQVAKAMALVFTAGVIAHVTGALRRSERQHRHLFEHVPDGIAIVSRDQRIVTVNRRFAGMVGRDPASLIGRKITGLFTHGPLGPVTPPTGVMGSPTSLLDARGKEIPVRTVAAPVTYQGGECVEMSVRDVGEQVRLERQLAQSQKMETIGRLAGGLARDFDDILDGITTAAQTVERHVREVSDPGARDKLHRHVAMIRDCSASAKEVVARLLGFSSPAPLDSETVDLKQIVTDVAGICRNTFGEHYSIGVETPPEPAVISGDGTSLTQALLNLCINARDAMPGGGSITLRLSAIAPEDEVWQRVPQAPPETEFWCIEAVDTGVGMARETVDKIFDPFFTTKPPGQGTGLGLSMVYNIVRQHGGQVEVSSKPGVGTTFRLFFERVTAGDVEPER
jgi:two-component system cell cycle sensor histidine kinase/response regulator CckA